MTTACLPGGGGTAMAQRFTVGAQAPVCRPGADTGRHAAIGVK